MAGFHTVYSLGYVAGYDKKVIVFLVDGSAFINHNVCFVFHLFKALPPRFLVFLFLVI